VTDPPIVLVTSAPPGRDEYRRDFLTCLAAPSGQLASFTYRTKWIDPSLLASPRLISGREAVLVFGDVPDGNGREFEFVAFRRARLRAFRPAELVRDSRLYNEDTHIAVDFSLERFVYAAPANISSLVNRWTSVLRALDERPRPYGHGEDGVSRFMFTGVDLEEGQPVEADSAWRALVEQLARGQSLAGAYFFRVAALRMRDADQQLEPNRDDKRLEYSLQTRGEYRLLLDAYSTGSEPAPADAIETLTTSDRLLVENPSTQTLGTGGRVAVDLTAGAVQAPTATTLVVRGRGPLSDRAPRIELVMRIRPRPVLIGVIIAMIAIGTGLSGLSKADLGTKHWYVVAIVKAAGVALVAAGLFWASRRTPGVSK
jgi:hypothetical protein